MADKYSHIAEETELPCEGCDLQQSQVLERQAGSSKTTRDNESPTKLAATLSQAPPANSFQSDQQPNQEKTAPANLNADGQDCANNKSQKPNMTINSLPQEIHDMIVSHLSDLILDSAVRCDGAGAEKKREQDSRISRYSTVSRRFQRSCERHLYSERLLGTTGDILKMQEVCTTAIRRRSLRRVDIEPTPIRLISCSVRHKQKKKIEEKLSRMISALVQMLHTWEVEQQELGIDCAEDISIRIDSPVVGSWDENCYHFRNHDWRLQLRGLDSLPIVNCVRDIRITWNEEAGKGAADFDGPTVAVLMAKFPRARQACLVLNDRMSVYMDRQKNMVHMNRGDYMGAWHGPRRERRQLLGQKLNDLGLFSHLQILKVDMKTRADVFQDMGMPNLIAPQQYDVFSAGLRKVSLNLRELYITSSAINESLFWPTAAETALDAQPPSFPNMEALCVAFSNASPAGKWYFRGKEDDPQDANLEPLVDDIDDDYPPTLSGSRSHDEHEGHQRDFPNHGYFRRIPNNDQVEPLLEAFAKAANRMPKLRTARLCTQINELALAKVILRADENDDVQAAKVRTYDQPGWRRQPCDPNPDNSREQEVIARSWAVTYYAPGTLSGDDDMDVTRRLHWATDVWRPPTALRQSFRTIGVERYPAPMIEKFTPRLTCKQYHAWLPRAEWQRNWEEINQYYDGMCEGNCFARW